MSEAFETMPAGRALDAEVAKAVGWTDVVVSGSHGGFFIGTPPNGHRYSRTSYIPLYSTSLSAAWALVEIITHDSRRFDLANEAGAWRVDIAEFTDGWVIASEATPALAIVRAFLLQQAKQVKR